ncbi:MAG: hypothetical protein J6Q83_08340 [Clostridia bacterium]|nr:hypothetical protein [Clostridia bacterium]
MKKYILLVLVALVCVVALSGCGGNGFGKDTTEQTVIQIEGAGLNVDMDADAAKVILGIYSKEELGLAKEFDEYDVAISGTKFEGVTGVKVEAFDPEAKEDAPAAGVFMIVDGQNYKFDAKQNKYVPIGGSKAPQTTAKAEPATSADGQPVETTQPIPDDPAITFQYHKGNNAALQEKFAGYNISPVGLANRLTDYVFIVTSNTGVTSDGNTVTIVELYTKSGENTGVKFGISDTADYYLDNETGAYVALAKNS